MADTYNVFISWSGDRSKRVAAALHDWLPMVVQTAAPWMSEEDIEKGSRGLDEIGKALEAMGVGIICLTPENLERPWILFEAGALSKALQATCRGYDALASSQPVAEHRLFRLGSSFTLDYSPRHSLGQRDNRFFGGDARLALHEVVPWPLIVHGSLGHKHVQGIVHGPLLLELDALQPQFMLRVYQE